MKRLGLDIGSTTVKCVVTDEAQNILFSRYERHLSRIQEASAALLGEAAARFPGEEMLFAMSGSAGMGMAADLALPFVQEVYATRTAVTRLHPETDCAVELGGEDAKILFLTGGLEVRMNGTCAGGTGAFIDQMTALMNIAPDELDDLAAQHEKLYTIASRCGVFAKSDIQPLINQGAKRADVAASIFYAVVNQTVAGLAQGREIGGNVLYLGGPLTFFSQLRAAFDDVLAVRGLCPENSLYYVALGAALSPSAASVDLPALASRLAAYEPTAGYEGCRPLFTSPEEYAAFRARHEADSAHIRTLEEPAETMYLGIDAGSTTVKALLCDADGAIFRPFYTPNSGNPVPLVRDYLLSLYRDYPALHIAGAAVTGYGEDIVKSAFHADLGVVETVAHYTAAKRFCPEVDFILDIGGQDIKCFRIRNGAVDSIFLNEACSSGCGSFLQTFAGVLGLTPPEFAEKALYADRPVDLGSRCTVFMNSSVKQAQKDGATLENISAGLSISVVKNALYKVIRCSGGDALGKNVVVQGGTFQNDAVLRAFEQEIGRNVIRPAIAGLMGAYGAALYAAERCGGDRASSLLGFEALEGFTHEVKAVTCSGCGNRCRLTVNRFSGGTTFIAGNRCSRPLGKAAAGETRNLYAYKNELLARYRENRCDPGKKTLGIPMGLNMYELLPFWHTMLTELGFNVVVSPVSSHELYRSGQHTIPSDTACYPAKLLHGHVEALLAAGVDGVFYPSMSYNLDEGLGANHYNCPVVAYYPEVIGANVGGLKNVDYFGDFIGLHDRKEFPPHFRRMMAAHGYDFSLRQVKDAAALAYAAYDGYLAAVRAKGAEYLAAAEREGAPVIVLAGRPYHIDPEICHGIDRLLGELGAVVVSEDAASALVPEKLDTTVLNQWTYHARLYAAARYVAEAPKNVNLVQLVSFGCGVDAVTTDEVRALTEQHGKPYTQIKIDEITNLGAVRIRLRSLFAFVGGEERK